MPEINDPKVSAEGTPEVRQAPDATIASQPAGDAGNSSEVAAGPPKDESIILVHDEELEAEEDPDPESSDGIPAPQEPVPPPTTEGEFPPIQLHDSVRIPCAGPEAEAEASVIIEGSEVRSAPETTVVVEEERHSGGSPFADDQDKCIDQTLAGHPTASFPAAQPPSGNDGDVAATAATVTPPAPPVETTIEREHDVPARALDPAVQRQINAARKKSTKKVGLVKFVGQALVTTMVTLTILVGAAWGLGILLQPGWVPTQLGGQMKLDVRTGESPMVVAQKPDPANAATLAKADEKIEQLTTQLEKSQKAKISEVAQMKEAKESAESQVASLQDKLRKAEEAFTNLSASKGDDGKFAKEAKALQEKLSIAEGQVKAAKEKAVNDLDVATKAKEQALTDLTLAQEAKTKALGDLKVANETAAKEIEKLQKAKEQALADLTKAQAQVSELTQAKSDDKIKAAEKQRDEARAAAVKAMIRDVAVTAKVTAIATDGDHVVVGTEAGEVFVFNVLGKKLRTLQLPGAASGVAINGDVVAATAGQEVRGWKNGELFVNGTAKKPVTHLFVKDRDTDGNQEISPYGVKPEVKMNDVPELVAQAVPADGLKARSGSLLIVATGRVVKLITLP